MPVWLDWLHIDLSERAAIFTFERADKLNSFDARLARRLSVELASVAGSGAAGALVLTGSGNWFSAGIDRAPDRVPDSGVTSPVDATAYIDECLTTIRRMQIPTIAAINGPAAGRGTSLALACEFRIMSAGASLRIDAADGDVVARIAGIAPAVALQLSNRPIDAREALSRRLVTALAAPQGALEAALIFAASIERAVRAH